MVFIRTKKINDNLYAYLVENITTTNGSRQKVKQYLGRVYQLKNKDNFEFNFDHQGDIILKMVLHKLKLFGFKKNEEYNQEGGFDYHYKNFIFSPAKFALTKKTKSKTVKEAVIALNDGYLCSFTLQRLVNFKKSKDVQKDGYLLAKYFLEAGFNISQEMFVKYYQGLK